jgi:hypothetical protein
MNPETRTALLTVGFAFAVVAITMALIALSGC